MYTKLALQRRAKRALNSGSQNVRNRVARTELLNINLIMIR